MDANGPPNKVFHHLGRIVAVLELGARAHGEAHWIHLYYALGFLPWAGLRETLQKHQQSVLPALERRGTVENYGQSLDLLAIKLQQAAGIDAPIDTFAAWASALLSEKTDTGATGLPTSSTPRTPRPTPRDTWTREESCRPIGPQPLPTKNHLPTIGTTTRAG